MITKLLHDGTALQGSINHLQMQQTEKRLSHHIVVAIHKA